MPFYITPPEAGEYLTQRVEEVIEGQGVEQEIYAYVRLYYHQSTRMTAQQYWEGYERPVLDCLASQLAKVPIFQPLAFPPETSTPGEVSFILPGRVPIRKTVSFYPVTNEYTIKYQIRFRACAPGTTERATANQV